MKFRLLPLVLLAVFGLAIAAETDYPLDAPAPAGLRPGGTLTHEFTPPPLHDEENKDIRRERNYPEQPPTIPTPSAATRSTATATAASPATAAPTASAPRHR